MMTLDFQDANIKQNILLQLDQLEELNMTQHHQLVEPKNLEKKVTIRKLKVQTQLQELEEVVQFIFHSQLDRKLNHP